ncbi:MAG: aldolase/citrate lyase family protein [Sedimentisphaerales bacterium]|nr:aldolase/citrate lyase family protein [Sedimentisphaerales bacterium]
MDDAEFLSRLKKGKRLYGTAILSDSPLWPLAVKRTGADFVFIDTEHIPIDRITLAQMCQVYMGHGLHPLVRIPTPDPQKAYEVLDGGASGILAPYIESPEQVRELVGAVKLRPLKGERLKEVLQNQDSLESELKDYLRDWNEGKFLIINIESVPAIERLEQILAEPGLDGVIIGPHDLSVSLGLPEKYHDPRFENAVKQIISKVREKGLGVGIHFSEGAELQIKWAKAGANIIIHSSDIALFQQRLKADITEIRRALGEEESETKDKTDTII